MATTTVALRDRDNAQITSHPPRATIGLDHLEPLQTTGQGPVNRKSVAGHTSRLPLLFQVPRRHRARRPEGRPAHGQPASGGGAHYLMKPSVRIHSSATVRGFFPSTLTSLFRAISVSVVSLSAIGVKSASMPGYFLATSLRTESAGL
jgi:hypothetical protein